jgi:DNA-binding response OmpR family regulator
LSKSGVVDRRVSAHAGLRETADGCGADDFLAKPFRVTELREIVKKYLSLSSTTPL